MLITWGSSPSSNLFLNPDVMSNRPVFFPIAPLPAPTFLQFPRHFFRPPGDHFFPFRSTSVHLQLRSSTSEAFSFRNSTWHRPRNDQNDLANKSAHNQHSSSISFAKPTCVPPSARTVAWTGVRCWCSVEVLMAVARNAKHMNEQITENIDAGSALAEEFSSRIDWNQKLLFQLSFWIQNLGHIC